MRIKYLIICAVAALALAGCSSGTVPPFASSSQWSLDGNVVSSVRRGMTINFGGTNPFPMTNLSNGEYALNYIVNDAQFQAYDSNCKKYIASAIHKLPFNVDSLELVLADQYVVFVSAASTKWMPDYVRQADGSELVVEAQPRRYAKQPEDEIWRNVITDNKQHRILVVDRIVKNGTPLGIMYIIQGANKKLPFSNTFHYDVTSPRNIQPVGEHMRFLLDITQAAHQSQVNRLTYSDYIHAADSCFMAGDYAGASKQFAMAFCTGEEIAGSHLYNAACAAALAGDHNSAFARLNARLSHDPNWYVDDPAADRDLASLHTDKRWHAYCDTIMARRDRIEAHFDKPLRARLQEIGGRDQEIRYEFLEAYRAPVCDQARIDSLTREMQIVDSINQVAICNILDKHGFVGSDKVGNACAVFWLVIQHAPVELQKKYFNLFEQAAHNGDISLEQVAMMDDRIAMHEGRPQRYGSQIVDGKLYRLLNPDKVDQWRKEMGMPPLDDYLKQMGASR